MTAGSSSTSSWDWDRLSVEEIDSWSETQGPPTPLLDTVNYPVHLKNFSMPQLRQLCKELRSDVVNTVSQTGGHLSSSLGVTELTVALHYVFNCPEDKLIWDVGHQVGWCVCCAVCAVCVCCVCCAWMRGGCDGRDSSELRGLW